MNRCTICVTPDSYPGLTLNTDGVCNHCEEYFKLYGDWRSSKAERKASFEKFVTIAKRRSRSYDALVPLSGGKDSTYVLYLASKVYKLRVLCYTFDNGFQSDVAKENIRAAAHASGADLVTYRPNPDMMMSLYRHFLKHAGMFCPVCMRGITAGEFMISDTFDVPLVLKGTSRRTEERLAPEIFQDGNISFFRKVLKQHPFDGNVGALLYDRSLWGKLQRGMFLLSRGRLRTGRIDLYMPDYFEWNYAEIFRVISQEMGWKRLPDRDEHIDCIAEPLVHYYIREQKIPELTQSTLRYSAEIRDGQMTREDALRIVEQERQERKSPKETTPVLERLGITEEALATCVDHGVRHAQFQPSGLVTKIRARLRQL
ncbi:MAG: hypothetical protein HY961_10465 [Ignavibacteriae bacterium]|nr:hypothetical protein [Ignavibacteriota bacterium]